MSVQNPSVRFYNEKQQLYLETDASGVRLGGLLQVRDRMQFPQDAALDNSALWPITFTSKSLISAETHQSNTDRKAVGILHGVQKFHNHCFMNGVSRITDHISLVAIFKKKVVILSHKLQRILLHIYQCNRRILYRPGPQLFIADGISRHNQSEKSDQER